MHTLDIRCRVCGTTGAHRRYVAREMMFGTREEFTYFLCSDCGCLQIATLPADLSKYYPDTYYSFHGDNERPRYKTRSRPRAYLERLRAGYALFGRGQKLAKLAGLVVDLPPEIYPAGSWLQDCGLCS